MPSAQTDETLQIIASGYLDVTLFRSREQHEVRVMWQLLRLHNCWSALQLIESTKNFSRPSIFEQGTV